MKFRAGVFLQIVFQVTLGCFAAAHGQMTKLNIASSGISPTQIPPYIAQEAGIYAKNGLEVSLIRTRSDVGVMSMLAGDTSIIHAAGPTIIRSNIRGGDCVFIAAGAVAFDYWLMAGKNIRRAEDLKGKILGVSSLRGSAISATRFALHKIGLDADRDVKIIQIGGTPDRLIALQTGRIDATLLSPPTSLAAEKEGFRRMADVAGLPFQNNGLATTRKFIREHPEIVRKYIKAHVEAIHLMKTNREIWIKVLSKYVKVSRDILDRSYDVSVTEELFPRKQYPSLEAIKTAMDEISEDEPKVKSLKAEDFVDMRFIAELDKSGYIESLYKNMR